MGLKLQFLYFIARSTSLGPPLLPSVGDAVLLPVLVRVPVLVRLWLPVLVRLPVLVLPLVLRLPVLLLSNKGCCSADASVLRHTPRPQRRRSESASLRRRL